MALVSLTPQIKSILDEITERLPDDFNMYEIVSKVPPEERTPYVVVAFQECERMNMLTHEIRRTLKELDLGLKVRSPIRSAVHSKNSTSGSRYIHPQDLLYTQRTDLGSRYFTHKICCTLKELDLGLKVLHP